MNTLKKEQVLVEQPMPEEQEELQAIFKELDVKIQEKLDVVMNKSGSCNWNCGGWNCGWTGSCAGCK